MTIALARGLLTAVSTMRLAVPLTCVTLLLTACPAPSPVPPLVPCTLTDAEWSTITTNHSAARFWDELVLHAIRRDIPAPTTHARNLFHVSAAMYDAWAAYDATAKGVFFTEKLTADDVEAARTEALSYAAYRVAFKRYRNSANGGEVAQCFLDGLKRQGFDPAKESVSGNTPSAVGNRIAAAIIAAGLTDGSNEQNGYADTTGWVNVNPPLFVQNAGNTTVVDPDLWQPLSLASAATQNNLGLDAGVQPYVGLNWKNVTPFALKRNGSDLYVDAGAPPAVADPAMRTWLTEVIRKQAQLAVDPAATIDLSPGVLGNNPVGTNDGTGRPLNPVTGQPYASNVVPVGDFGRVMAEFWADGPKSETPPGHWNVIANGVTDSPNFPRQLGGAGPSLTALEWDVKLYLALNGALHDAAIVAWEQKRVFTRARPIALIRWYAGKGQSSDPTASDYDASGLAVVPGLLERVTLTSSGPGQPHEGLVPGSWAVRGWKGSPPDPSSQVGGIGWQALDRWATYQRSTFVTPAFPGFISGHSTFSRAGAEVLADLTGSPFFPGGLGHFVAEQNAFLTFEEGPSVRVELQWATYYDAADQAGQSRLWGGIHIVPDDFEGRRAGQQVGLAAAALARKYFAGSAP